MKILNFSFNDISGGAARAAYRLHSGLRLMNAGSQMMVVNKSSDDVNVIKYKFPVKCNRIQYKIYKKRIDRDFNKYKSSKPPDTEVFSDDRSALKYGFFGQIPEADIYNLHWISGFVDLPSFLRRIDKPLVWTLHDMLPFTGGCHYNAGCEKYKTHCHACPQLGSAKRKDLSYKIWERKYKALSGFSNKIAIRADSHWLAKEAGESGLFKGLDIDAIHYGVETDIFIQRDKNSCRKAFDIPPDARLILFGAPGIHNPRKGFKLLDKALHQVQKSFPDLFLLSFGSGSIQTDLKIPRIHLGHIANNHLLSIAYNCADLFVIPSLQEAFGQTALEAMSCGVPVAGFNTGGIPEIVTNGETGYLAQTGNINELAEAINSLLSLDENAYAEMATKCRKKVIEKFTLKHQAEKYIVLYNLLLKNDPGFSN